MNSLFGTDGIRGVVNKNLTNELAMKIGKATAKVLADENVETPLVMIGRDTRASGDMLEAAITAGFCSVGANVLDVGVIPTPAIAYLVGKYNCDAGVVISASHNPCEYNGIKLFQKSGYKLPDKMEDEIEYLVSNIDSVKIKTGGAVGRRMFCESAVSDYIEHILGETSMRFDGMNIAIDTANGSTGVCAKEIFTKLGAKCYMLSDTPDGTNINKNCGSTHMEEISKFVKANNLDLGLAFDGDGDRLLAVDENGQLVDGDKIMAICAMQMKEENKLTNNTAVVTVMSNMGLFKFCEENGINCVKTAVGDRYVLEKMLEGGYNIGGEQSGHIIFLDSATTGDGEISAVKLLEAVKKSNKTLGELQNIMAKYPQVLVNVETTDEGKKKYNNDEYIISAIQEVEMDLQESGRVLVRVSGTEPFIRVMVEGKDIDKITRCANYIANVIKKRLG